MSNYSGYIKSSSIRNLFNCDDSDSYETLIHILLHLEGYKENDHYSRHSQMFIRSFAVITITYTLDIYVFHIKNS